MPKFNFQAALIFTVIALAIIVLFSWRSGCAQSRRADQAVTVGKQLDKVAKETPAIRAEQKEKEDEVQEIDGADQPLPDGFGAELERVRRGSHSR
jgi:hypothetical protein